VAGLARPEVMLPFAPTSAVGWLAGQITDVPSLTVEALVESLHHDMVCAEEDFRADLLPAGYELTGVREAITRALGRPVPGDDPADVDPLGPVPGDPAWAGGEIHVDNGLAVRTPRSPAASLLLGLPRIEGDRRR
jgi:hypothetical protein